MDLKHLLENYKPAYPSSGLWEATKAEMMSDPYEAEIVEHLCAVLLAGKKFREPVLLGLVDEDVEENEPAFYSVFNGTHRVVAHMITNMSEVYVEHYVEPEPASDEDEFWVATKVKLSSALSDEVSDSVFSALRSFPLDDKVWVESFMLIMPESSIEIIWTFSVTETHLFEQVTNMVSERLERLGVTDFEVVTAVDFL